MSSETKWSGTKKDYHYLFLGQMSVDFDNGRSVGEVSDQNYWIVKWEKCTTTSASRDLLVPQENSDTKCH